GALVASATRVGAVAGAAAPDGPATAGVEHDLMPGADERPVHPLGERVDVPGGPVGLRDQLRWGPCGDAGHVDSEGNRPPLEPLQGPGKPAASLGIRAGGLVLDDSAAEVRGLIVYA